MAFDEVTVSDRALMLGDFNADPFDEEMWDEDRIFALRDASLVAGFSMADSVGQRVPLWNPSWKCLASGDHSANSVTGGTHYFAKDLRHSQWLLFDQILTSVAMARHFKRIHIPTTLYGPLLKQTDTGTFEFALGDHLPVVANFEYGANNALQR